MWRRNEEETFDVKKEEEKECEEEEEKEVSWVCKENTVKLCFLLSICFPYTSSRRKTTPIRPRKHKPFDVVYIRRLILIQCRKNTCSIKA